MEIFLIRFRSFFNYPERVDLAIILVGQDQENWVRRYQRWASHFKIFQYIFIARWQFGEDFRLPYLEVSEYSSWDRLLGWSRLIWVTRVRWRSQFRGRGELYWKRCSRTGGFILELDYLLSSWEHHRWSIRSLRFWCICRGREISSGPDG